MLQSITTARYSTLFAVSLPHLPLTHTQPQHEATAIVNFLAAAQVDGDVKQDAATGPRSASAAGRASSLPWRRVLVQQPLNEAVCVHHVLRRHLLSTPLASDHCGTRQAQTVRVLAAAEERLRSRVPTALPRTRDLRNSALHRLQTLAEWTAAWPSAEQVAEAGFGREGRANAVRHFTAVGNTQAAFDVSDSIGRSRLRLFINERIARGSGPPGAAWNVPLAAALNALPATLPPRDFDSSEFAAGLSSPLLPSVTSACPASGLLATATDDGIAGLWTVEPALFSLVTCNLRQPQAPVLERRGSKAAYRNARPAVAALPRYLAPWADAAVLRRLDAEEAQDVADMARLVHLGVVASGSLLGPRFLLALFADEDTGCVLRILGCEPLLTQFVRDNRSADGVFR